MKATQIAWLCGLVAFVCTTLIGQAELIGEPWRHYVTVGGVLATAIAGFMLQHPWDGQTDRRLEGKPTYIVIQDGVGKPVTHDGAAAILKDAATDMPQPLPIVPGRTVA